MSKKDKREMTEEEEEVHIKKVRIMGFIAGAIVAALFYIGIPYGMIHYVEPDFDTYMEKLNLDLQIVWTNLLPLFERWMYAGIPMVVLGALTWSFPKGSRQRFINSPFIPGKLIQIAVDRCFRFKLLPDSVHSCFQKQCIGDIWICHTVRRPELNPVIFSGTGRNTNQLGTVQV